VFGLKFLIVVMLAVFSFMVVVVARRLRIGKAWHANNSVFEPSGDLAKKRADRSNALKKEEAPHNLGGRRASGP
jgi:hypothetical protein